MSIYKRGEVYWYKFMWKGELVRESTKQGNDKVARQMEAAHRTSLAKGEVGIRDKKPSVGLSDYLKKDFLPFVEANSKAKPKTAVYYRYGVTLLLASDMGSLRLEEITSQHAAGFIARNSRLSASTMNCGLRTLRRALKLAEEWGKLERSPKVTLATGERQRERIVTEAEFLAYVELCRQPWHDVAVLLYGSGIRPGEAYKLRWEHVIVNGAGGVIQIAEGKSRAARRFLPMVPEVYRTTKARWESLGRPAEGWVFPAGSVSGHLEESAAKIHHAKALHKLQAATAAIERCAKNARHSDWQAVVATAAKVEKGYVSRHAETLKTGVKPFEPYCLRHTALTRLAEAGCDAFTLARIAGHSSITITQRYCHPQADAIERAFGKLAGGHKIRHSEISQLPETVAEDTLTLSAVGD